MSVDSDFIQPLNALIQELRRQLAAETARADAAQAEVARMDSLAHDWQSQYAEAQAENARLREALEEMTKPPYKDSDLRSFIEWINCRARAVLSEGR